MAPSRIVSLVPSLTEALFAFGVGGKVVGRTRYCTQPPRSVGRIPKIGGTKKANVPRILDLGPDLVVAVKEENTREDVEALREAGVPVFLGEPASVAGAVEMLADLSEATGAPRAGPVLEAVRRSVERVRGDSVRPLRVFVPIWKDPYMGVGGDTYVHDVLRVCGGENVCGGSRRYPVVTTAEIEAFGPEVVLLPDEPYPFSAEDLPEFYAMDTPAARSDGIFLVDGKLLTWYGPRMAGSLVQLAALMR